MKEHQSTHKPRDIDDKLFKTELMLPTPMGPDVYNEVDKFRDWALSIREFFGVHNQELADALNEIEGTKDELTIEEQHLKTDQIWNDRLYSILLYQTLEEAKTTVRTTPLRGGLEAWRRLHRTHDPATVERTFVDHDYIMHPPKVKTPQEVPGAISRWEAALTRIGAKKGLTADQVISDGFRHIALQRMLPESVMKDIRPQIDRFPTTRELKEKVESVVNSMHQGLAPMLFGLDGEALSQEDAEDDEVFACEWDDQTEAFTLVRKGKGKGKGKGGKGKRDPKGKGKGKNNEDMTCYRCGRK
jgi:hypothetical protein